MNEERFHSQLLGEERGPNAVAVVDRLLAVQAQDLRSARLALRARTDGLTVADVDRELTERRSLVVGWLNRGTLQLVRSEDYRWLHALVTPPLLRPVATRLAGMGVTPDVADRAADRVVRELADGPLTRGELRARLDAAGLPTAGQILVHVLFLACLHGSVLRGPIVGKEHAYVLVDDWLPRERKLERTRALGRLAERYVAGHANADDKDLAWWSGLPLRDARAALSTVRPSKAQRSPLRPVLLGQWDPLLVGWASRDRLLGAWGESRRRIEQFRPLAFVDGRAVATWTSERGRVVLDEFEQVARSSRKALLADVADVERFIAAT